MAAGSVNGDARHRKLGSLIAAVRRARGYTQPGCAERAGIGTTTLERIEYGGRVRRQTLERVATAIGLPDAVLDAVLVAHGYLPTAATWARMVAADRLVQRLGLVADHPAAAAGAAIDVE